MQIYVSVQAEQALYCLALGAAAGVWYDLLRAFRRRSRVRAVGMLIDLMFWMVLLASTILTCFGIGGGQVRLFMLASIVLGTAAYFTLLSRWVRRIMEYVADFIEFLFYCAVRPLVWSCVFLKKVWIFAKNIFHYLRKWSKMKKNIAAGLLQYEKISPDDKETRHESQTGKYIYETGRSGSDGVRGSHSDRPAGEDRRRGSAKRHARTADRGDGDI